MRSAMEKWGGGACICRTPEMYSCQRLVLLSVSVVDWIRSRALPDLMHVESGGSGLKYRGWHGQQNRPSSGVGKSVTISRLLGDRCRILQMI